MQNRIKEIQTTNGKANKIIKTIAQLEKSILVKTYLTEEQKEDLRDYIHSGDVLLEYDARYIVG